MDRYTPGNVSISDVRKARIGALPNVVVIGAMKCGTSSMHNYLNSHAEIRMSRQKEINFFGRDDLWERGPEWYATHFSASARVRGESCPDYSKFPRCPEASRRMKQLIPDAKLIYLVRDPIDRIVSHYAHARESGRETRPIEEALRDFENNKYVEPSCYYTQLERYSELFPQSQIHVACTEEMSRDREGVLREIFRFLGVDESFRSPRQDALYHVSGKRGRIRRAVEGTRLARAARPYVPAPVVFRLATWGGHRQKAVERPVLPDPLADSLRAYLSDEVDRLSKQVGREFPSWSL